MKKIFILLFLLNLNCYYSNVMRNKKLVNSSDDDDIMKVINNFIKKSIEETLIKLNYTTNISRFCLNKLNESINEPDQLYLIKLFRDSSKNKNDIGSYLDCFTINYKSRNNNNTSSISKNITYSLFHIKKNENWYNISDTRYETGNLIYGACISNKCNSTEYEYLFYKLNDTFSNFPNASLNDIHVYDYGEFYTENSFSNVYFYIEMIPFGIFIMLLTCTCYPLIPKKIFSCCFKKKIEKNKILHQSDYEKNRLTEKFNPDDSLNNKFKFNEGNQAKNKLIDIDESREIDISEPKHEYNSNQKTQKIVYDEFKLNKFTKCFNLIENAEEILNTNSSIHNVNINNDSGLSIVRGIRGFNILFIIIGYVFKTLYSSPLKIFCTSTFTEMQKSYFFSIILYGIRFGPRMFFAMSAFCLIYKFLCYLDSEVDKIDNILSASQDSDRQDKNLENNINNHEITTNSYRKESAAQHNEYSFTKEENESKLYENLKKNSNMTVEKKIESNKFSPNSTDKNLDYLNTSSNFSSRLLYSKYFYFIFLHVYQYLLYILVILFFKFSFYHFIKVLFTPGPMWVYLKKVILDKFNTSQILKTIFLISGFSSNSNHEYDMFWMATNEIFFFIFFSFIIFIFYKYNWRLDLFLIFMLLFLIISKFLLYVLINKYDGIFLPSLSYQYYSNYFLTRNPFYNMSHFIIGLLFGLVNYCIQQSISSENLTETNKRYLYLPCKFRSFFKRQQICKVFTISILFIIIFFFCFFDFNIICSAYLSNDIYMNDLFTNVYANLFFLIDVELGIFSIFLVIITLFMYGDNFLIAFFKHEYFNFLSRPYFIFILELKIFAIYVFYQSESRVKLEIFNIIFFSLLVLMLSMMFCALIYILIEVPLKKLNKFIIEEIKENRQEKEEKFLLNYKNK